jgi:hypothetical protein
MRPTGAETKKGGQARAGRPPLISLGAYPNVLKKSFPLSSTRTKAGKSSTSMR